jgi:hypothetical protein
MAITREQLEFKIGVEAGQLIKSLDDITTKTKKLSKDTNDLEGSIKNVSKTESLYQQAIENTVKTMQTEQDAITEINDRLNVFSKQLEDINDAVSANGFAKLQSSLTNITSVMQSLIPISNLFASSLMKIADPSFVKRLDRVLAIFQLIAALRGFEKLALFIEFIREKVDLLHDRLVLLQRIMNYLNPPSEQVTTFAEKVDNLSNSIASLKVKADQGQAAMDAMTDPNFAARLDDVLMVAQAVASFKGFDVLAESIKRARVAIQSLLDTMREFNNNGLSASENFSNITSLSKAYLGLKSVLEGVYTAIKIILTSLAAGFAVMVGLSFIEQMKGFAGAVGAMGSVFDKVMLGMILSFSNFTNAVYISYLNVIDIFQKMTRGIVSNLASAASNITTFWNNTAQNISTFYGVIKRYLQSLLAQKLLISEGFHGLMKSGSAAAFAVHTAFEFLAQAFVHQIAVNIIESGQQIAAVMDQFTDKAAKAEQATAQFEFTVQSFGDTIGVNAVGSLEEWTKVIEELGSASASTRTELQKSSKLLIADGVALGLSFQDSTDLLRRGVDIAANSGRDLFDVTQALLSGISGTAQAVIPLGINLSAHALEHSDLNKQMMKTSDSMTELEKKEIRLSEIMRQTIPIMGASGAQRETLIGINKRLEKSYDNISVQIGSNNVLILKAKSAYADFIQSLESVPNIFYSLAGAIMDVSSIFLIGAGVVLKYSVTVLSLVGSYKFLSSAIEESKGVQKAFNSVLNNLGKVFAFQAVAVTNMATLYKNLKMVVFAIATQGFTLMASAIASVTAKIWANTVAVLSNPLFWKAAAIVAGITAVVYAFKELNEEIGLFSLDNVSVGGPDTFEFLHKPLKSIVQTFKSAITIAVEFAKQVIIGLTAIGLTFVAVGTIIRRELNAWFTNDQIEDDALGMYIDDIKDRLALLGGAANKSRDTVGNAFTQIIGNSSAMADEMKLAAKAAEELNYKLKSMEDASKSIDFASMSIQALGSDVDKLKNSYETAALAVEKSTDAVLKGSEDASKSIDEYKKAIVDQAAASLAIDKFKIDRLKQIEDITKQISKDILKLSSDETQQIKSEFAERRDAVREFEKSIAQLGPVSTEAASKIKAAYKAIETAQRMALSAAQKKREDEAIAETLRLIKEERELLKGIKDRNLDISKVIAGERLTAQQKIMSDLKLELEALDERIKSESQYKIVNLEVIKALEDQRKLLIESAEVQKRMADMELPDWIDQLSVALKNAFAFEAAQDFFGFIGNQVKKLQNSKIVLYIEKEITETKKSLGMGEGGAVSNAMSSVGDAVMKAGEVAYAAGGALVSAVVKAGGWVGAFIDVVMNADKYLRVLIEFPKQFLQVIKNLPGLVKQFIDQFPGMIRAIAEALPTILIKLVDQIPSFIAAFIDAIPLMIERLAEALPEIFIKIIAMIPRITVMLARGFFLAMQSFIKGLIRGLGRLFSGLKMPKVNIDTNEAQKQFKKIAGTAGRLFSVKDLAETVKDPVQELMKGIEDTFRKGTNWIKDAWQWVLDKIWTPIKDAIMAVWTWVKDKILMPIWNALSAIVRGAFGFVQGLWDALGQVVSAAWFFVQNLWDTLGTIVSTAFQFVADLWNGLSGIVSAAFGWIVDNVITPMTTIGEKIAAPIAAAFQSILLFFDQWIIQPLKSIAESFTRIMSTMGEKVTAAFSSVFMFFQDLQKFITKAFEPVFQFFGNIGQSIVDGVKKAATGGGITIGGEVGKAAETVKSWFAAGGEVPLYAAAGVMVPRGTDTVPAMLTPGEFVMSKRGVNTAGLGMLQGINSGQMPTAGNTYNIQFEINVEAKTTMDEGFIRQQLIPKMRENLKRASLDGEFVLSSKGVRA